MKTYFTLLLSVLPFALLAQTGPAGVGTTDGTSLLKLWLDAGKGVFRDTAGKQKTLPDERVYKWRDLSGSNNDVYAMSDSSRPLFIVNSPLFNQASTIKFSRNGDKGNKRNFLESRSFPKTTDISIFCVFLADSKGGGNNISPYKFKGNTYNDTLWYEGAGLVDADVESPLNDVSMTLTDSSLAAGGGDSSLRTEFTIKTRISLKKPNIGFVQRTWDGRLRVGQNGKAPLSYAIGKQPINNSIKYTIGATSNIKYGKDYNFFDGEMAQVMVFNKELTEAETIIIYNYLSSKYGIPLAENDVYKGDDSLLGNHDYELAGIGMGIDGLAQTRSQGEGIVEISALTKLQKGSYLMWANNGLPLTHQMNDVPEGVLQRLERTWRVNEINETGPLNLIVDTKKMTVPVNHDLLLLIDTDNDLSFENETIGQGMVLHSSYLGNGQYLFSDINLSNDQRFTFAILKPACQENCESVFTPNGDGVADTYYVQHHGKTVIMDKFGQKVKEMNAPTFWDGFKSDGTPAKAGLYFLVAEGNTQKTVTLLK